MTDRPRRFDRIKAPDQRLLERPEGARFDTDDTDPDGRAALFSHGHPPSGGPGGPPSVHCSRCDETTPVDAGTALRSVVPLFLVAPWRDHPVFAVCPACRRRSWLRPGRGA